MGDDWLARNARRVAVHVVAQQTSRGHGDRVTDEALHNVTRGARAYAEKGKDEVRLPQSSSRESEDERLRSELEITAQSIEKSRGSIDDGYDLKMPAKRHFFLLCWWCQTIAYIGFARHHNFVVCTTGRSGPRICVRGQRFSIGW